MKQNEKLREKNGISEKLKVTGDIISVGIPTAGNPVLERCGNMTLLKNMLIGKDFHWQRSIEALLPGDIEIRVGEEFPVINHVPVETYLRCVVGSEMNPNAPAEFLKAHAVISRGWALGKILHLHDHSSEGKCFTPERITNWEDTSDHIGFDVCSDDHCQRYQGIQPVPGEVEEALAATGGEVLFTSGGKLVDTRFSKCCGGVTEVFSSCWQDREEECLESVEDPWCDLGDLPEERRELLLGTILKDYDLQNNGGYSWTAWVSAAEIRKNLADKFGRDVGEVRNIEVIRRGLSGRAVTLGVEGSKGYLEIGKELMIRRLLAPTHLYSSWIEIIPDSAREGWLIKGRGWGHGVGLCQIGAARMAVEGYGYAAILAHYYPGSTLCRLQC